MSNAQRIPAFVNPESGTAEGARNALGAAGPFDIVEVPPARLREEIESTIRKGARRILVAGGDGTVRTAAAAVAGTNVELAIFPGGTLNHFARDHGIPTDPDEAIATATDGDVVTADAAYVGDELFINTSSIGAYVTFMRVREELERYLGYRVATLLASIRTFFYLRSYAIELEIDGKKQTYRSPIVFIGVGERELQMPSLGNRVENGKRGLHVMIVTGRFKARLLALAWGAVSRGIESAARSPHLDAYLVDRCSIRMKRRRARIAVDGEALELATPLEYRVERDILRIVRGK